jgi:hypothetical protein
MLISLPLINRANTRALMDSSRITIRKALDHFHNILKKIVITEAIKKPKKNEIAFLYLFRVMFLKTKLTMF